MSISELVRSGAIREGAHCRSTIWGISAQEMARLAVEQDGYAGALILRANEPLPAIVGPRCWAERVFTAEQPNQEQYLNGKIVNSEPPLWLVTWTTDEIEESWAAAKRAQSVVSLDTFHAMRSAGIEDR